MTNNDDLALRLKKEITLANMLGIHPALSTLTADEISSLLAERDADKKRIAELEAEASCKFMPVGVMSQSKFESLDNGDVRFIALWPRPCVPVRRKRPDDGVLVYAKVAGINLEVGE